MGIRYPRKEKEMARKTLPFAKEEKEEKGSKGHKYMGYYYSTIEFMRVE
jgi:hypothetical protein